VVKNQQINKMYRGEATEAESQQTTSTNKESRENIPISTTAPKKVRVSS